MARTIERRDIGGVVVAEPPVILEPPEAPITIPTPRGEPRGRGRLGTIVRPLLLITLLGGGYFAYQKVPAVYESVNSLAASTAEWWNSFSAPFDPNKKIQVAPSGIPQFQPSVPSEYITPETANKTPEALAKEAGYNIIWKDPKDTTGRTVFYDYRGGWGGGIGENYSQQNGTDGKVYRHRISMVGSFGSFEAIPASKDKYIILKDPRTGVLFQKIRIDFEGKIVTTEGMRPTNLGIENISLNKATAQSSGVNGKLEYVPQWDKEQLARIIQPGDAVHISLTAVKGISGNVLQEENNVVTANYEPYFAGSIIVRRFGGKAQIEKELASP